MVAIWGEVLGDKLPLPSKSTTQRRRTCATRLRDDFGGDLDAWRQFCRRISASPFLTGENNRGWRPNFDWALKPANLLKIQEGAYDDRATAGAGGAGEPDRPKGPPPRPEDVFGPD